MKSDIELKKKELEQICKALNIAKMYVFGSFLTESYTEKSDIDFLISFPDDMSIEDYTENYFALHYKLRELFNREIDVVTERTLSNPYFIESINENKKLIYEA